MSKTFCDLYPNHPLCIHKKTNYKIKDESRNIRQMTTPRRIGVIEDDFDFENVQRRVDPAQHKPRNRRRGVVELKDYEMQHQRRIDNYVTNTKDKINNGDNMPDRLSICAN